MRRRRAPASSFVRAHRLVAVLALVAALGFVAVPSSCETSDARDGEGISSLSAWLAKFKFDLPKQTFRVPYAGIDVELDAMTCVNLTVGALASETTATANVDVGGGDGEGELRANTVGCEIQLCAAVEGDRQTWEITRSATRPRRCHSRVRDSRLRWT